MSDDIKSEYIPYPTYSRSNQTNETFARGEWVEVSEFCHTWEKKIFFNSLSHRGKIYGYLVYDSEPPSLNFSCWYNIRKIPQPQKPKKTVKIMIAMPHS